MLMSRNGAKADLEIANAATWTPVNEGRRKRCGGSIGSLTMRSTTMKASIRTAAPASSDTMRALLQPSALSLVPHERQHGTRSASETANMAARRRPARPGPSSRMAGNATLTTVMSSNSVNVATEAATKVHRLRCIPDDPRRDLVCALMAASSSDRDLDSAG
jgi:hypothetical protein